MKNLIISFVFLLSILNTVHAACVEKGHYYVKNGLYYHGYYSDIHHSQAYKYQTYYEEKGQYYKDDRCEEPIEILDTPQRHDSYRESLESNEFYSILNYARELLYYDTICFNTGFAIMSLLEKDHNYQKVLSLSSKNEFFPKLVNTIENILGSKEDRFIFVRISGHFFWLEVNGNKQYVRLYTSFGERYTLEQWIYPELEFKPAQVQTYSYDLEKAKKARNHYGAKIKAEQLQAFLNHLSAWGNALSPEEAENELEEIFGVRYPTPHALEKFKSGNLDVYKK